MSFSTDLIVIRNVLIFLLSLATGIWLLWIWWWLVRSVHASGGRVYFGPGWWRPTVLLVLGLVMALGPFVSMYLYYREDREDAAVRTALVVAHNDFGHREFVNRYNLDMSSIGMAALDASILAGAYARAGTQIRERLQEHMRHTAMVQDTFLARYASTAFAERMARRPRERGKYFLASTDLSEEFITLDQARWAHRTDSTVFGLVKVEFGRYVFDGFVDSARVAAR